MMTPDINPVELKVFLNHIYELKKGVRQMVLYTTHTQQILASCQQFYDSFAIGQHGWPEAFVQPLWLASPLLAFVFLWMFLAFFERLQKISPDLFCFFTELPHFCQN